MLSHNYLTSDNPQSSSERNAGETEAKDGSHILLLLICEAEAYFLRPRLAPGCKIELLVMARR
jgi:hypothetical protein